MIQENFNQPIQLPLKVVCDVFKYPNQSINQSIRSNLLENPVKQEIKDVTVDKIVKNLTDYLSNKFYSWQKNQEFKFKLPESHFDQKRQLPIILYQQAEFAEQELQVRSLSQSQLESIKQDGTFLVPSRQYPIPYKWILSEWIYKGKAKTYESYEKDFGTSYSQIYEIKQRINNQKFSIIHSVINIFNFFTRIISILFGKKAVYKHTRRPVYQVLELERHKKILQKYWPAIDKSVYQYLNVNPALSQADKKKLTDLTQKRQKQIRQLYNKCLGQWQRRRQQILDQLEQMNQTQNIDKILKDEKQKVFTKYYTESSIDKAVLNQLLFLQEQFKIISKQAQQKANKISKSQERLRAQLKNQFSIRSYCQKWFNKTFNQKMDVIKKHHQENYLAQLKRELKIPFFEDYIQFCQGYQQKTVEITKNLMEQTPVKTHQQRYRLFPPYKVVYKPENVGYQYSLQKYQTIKVETDHYFWKFKLYFVRYYVWCRNIIYFAYRNMIVGPLGLGILFGCKVFYPVYIINTSTGQLGRYMGLQMQPISVSIVKNISGISKIREQFQNAPDNGFFGKVCARICNILYCYIFVLIIYTCIYLIIIKPLIIILNVIFCLFLFLTVFIWMPIVLLLTYLFNILIYQFENPQKYQQSFVLTWFPLIFTTIDLVIDIIFLIINIVMLVIHPLLAFIVFLFANIRYLFRRIYDGITYVFISCCARSPVRDTWIAWKISGPGISRNYFRTIKQADIYILLLAELQKIQLALYQKQVIALLDKPLIEKQEIMYQICRQLYCDRIGNQQINQSIAYYKNRLSQQLNQRRNHYINSPGSDIRFTQQELNQYTGNSKQIIRNFMKKNPNINLFEYYGIKKQNMDKLVIKLWFAIFQNEAIFQPLEDIDSRFQVKERREVDQVSKMMTSLERQVPLSTGFRKDQQKFEYTRNRDMKQQINYTDENQIITIITVLERVLLNLQDQLCNSYQDIYNSIMININIEYILAKWGPDQ